ncbi:MAG TPA: heparinase [Gammaproteobacteria bacterium]|nr:heparinase [Gammaproteobacteria bacterium]
MPPRLRLPLWLPLAWAVLISYGSLLPFHYVPISLAEGIQRFQNLPLLMLGAEQRADLLANFLLYLPLGFGLAAALPGRSPNVAAGLLAAILGCGLAFAIEFTQAWFPNRTASLNDLIAECVGSGGGVLIYRLSAASMARWVGALTRPDKAPLVDAALALYALAWLSMALFPLDFVMSAAELDWRLNLQTGFWIHAESAASPFRLLVGLLVEFLAALPLGALLARRAGLAGAPVLTFLLAALLSTAMEVLQLLMISGVAQGVSAAARAAGLVAGAALASGSLSTWADRLRAWRHPAWTAAIGLGVYLPLALVAVVTGKGPWDGLADVTGRLHALQWLPFYYHYYTSEPVAMRSLLATVSLYAPLGALLALARLGRLRLRGGRRLSALPAVLLGFLTALVLEGLELGFRDARPDPTTLIIAPMGVWLAFRASEWLVRTVLELHPQHGHGPMAAGAGLRAWASGVAVPLLAIGVVLSHQWERLQAEVATASIVPMAGSLPSPASLPPVQLAHFRNERPRLPAPRPGEQHHLDEAWLKGQRHAAEQGRPEALILMARLEPGRWPLDALRESLLAEQPAGRWQARNLSLAYDWLHDQWAPTEREALREALISACDDATIYIRREALSPYHYALYAHPLQELLACSIALYRDDPRANALFNFAHHLLETRVRPVWEQVMADGGWHEGREYVGLGIGRAVFQVPALWRHATGLNWFAELPGLRGFLDFLVYRSRPDGTLMRLGDGNRAHEVIADQAALALEYRHAAAYSLANCLEPGRPAAWPWGPLADPALCAPEAVQHLDRSRAFRGIGLLVSRTDWSPEATYVTFKAGDNFWSHQHLDQGSFTLYRGGALAIDSGSYGRRHGSDHHLNYHSQSIAHNVVTVTDPADTVPLPRGSVEAPRPIANDGGQRRVGSGWNLGRAPLDRGEWEAAFESYHTGRWLATHASEDLSVVVADLTPAYTNRWSGLGRFADRTRRVERYVRTFVHDRAADIVLVRDTLKLAEGDFTTRWLLHTLDEPVATPAGFRANVPPGAGPGRAGASLHAVVMGPHPVKQVFVGGPGREFEVDGRNYDDDGEIQRFLATRPPAEQEAGAWRVELIAPSAHEAEFLVALLPRDATADPSAQVQRLATPDEYGCEWDGGGRRLRWWFRAGEDLPRIERQDAGGDWQPLTLRLEPAVSPDGSLQDERTQAATAAEPAGVPR